MVSRINSKVWDLQGYIADLPTPFDRHDRIDLAALARLCERQIDAGARALVVAETTGESSTLTLDEHDAVVRCAAAVTAGRVVVVAGAGSNSTSQAIIFAQHAEAAGADAIISVTPYYNKPLQTGIQAHFQAIAAATSLPIILHDAPFRTSRGIDDDTVARLAETRQIIGIRDTSGDVTRPFRLRSLVPTSFRILSGDDATALAYLANGGDGCVSVVANVAPELCRMLYLKWTQGELEGARAISDKLSPLAHLIAGDATPAGVKHALSHAGLMASYVRLPIFELTGAQQAAIVAAMNLQHSDHCILAEVQCGSNILHSLFSARS